VWLHCGVCEKGWICVKVRISESNEAITISLSHSGQRAMIGNILSRLNNTAENSGQTQYRTLKGAVWQTSSRDSALTKAKTLRNTP